MYTNVAQMKVSAAITWLRKKVCCNLVKCEKQCHLFTRFYAKHLVQDKLELVGLQSDLFVATLVKRRTQR